MGKGDKRTKRGKLYRGTHGKIHPSNPPPAPAKPSAAKPAKAAKPRPQVTPAAVTEGEAEATPAAE